MQRGERVTPIGEVGALATERARFGCSSWRSDLAPATARGVGAAIALSTTVRRTLLLALIALPAMACTAEQPAVGALEQNIVGGEMARTTDYPSVVALAQGDDWFCTGTLIDKDWVLTAAHCVEDMAGMSLQVRLDSSNLNFRNAGRTVGITAIYSHAGYNGHDWDNDIALVRLAESITDREPTPIHRAVTAPTTSVWQVGYGATSDTDDVGGILRRLKTSTIDCAMVATMTGDTSITATNVVCFDQSDGNGTCYGDSGGPSFVTVDGKLQVAAITSGGTLESCQEGFDIQTAISGELDFIDDVMAGNMEPDAPGKDASTETSAGGCNATGTGTGSLLLFGLAALLLRRRR
jgi:uncharacterized protein (TIGR03382 family)